MIPKQLFAKQTRQGMLLLSGLIILSVVLAACGGSTTVHKTNQNSSLTLLANASGDYPRNFNPYSPSTQRLK